jgi:hypothetical protein
MPSKTNNGQGTAKRITNNVVTNFSEETKAGVDSLLNMAAKASEDSRALWTANQELLRINFALWQECTQAYANFVVEATQQTLGQSLAFRESLDKALGESLKKAQVLSLEERQIALDTVKLSQAQARAVAEYAAEIFTTTSKVMTTTALFSDWAAERVVKMFATISAPNQ